MEEKNNMQENGSVFGNMNNPDTASEKDLYKGLDSDTFGKVENETGEQDATVYTSPWNSDAYIPGGQTDYYSTQPPVSEKKQSKALEICALVFGILSLCGCCYGLFGLIGLVLSIIALAKGKKSGLSIAGLILSIIGIVGALVWTIFCFSSAGQEWSSNIAESFMEGFEEGYNATYDNSSTEVESDVDIETESNATADASGADAGSLEGNTKEQNVLIYYGNDNADGIIYKEVTVKGLSPENLIKELAKVNIVSMDTKVKSVYVDDEDKKLLHLDMSKEFSEYLSMMGTAGEYIVLGGLVDTFLDAYDCEKVKVTVEGKTLETGHATYEGELQFFEVYKTEE